MYKIRTRITKNIFPLYESYISVLQEAENTIFNGRIIRNLKDLQFDRNGQYNYISYKYKIFYHDKNNRIIYSIYKLMDDRIFVENCVESRVNPINIHKIMVNIHEEIQKFKKKKIRNRKIQW